MVRVFDLVGPGTPRFGLVVAVTRTHRPFVGEPLAAAIPAGLSPITTIGRHTTVKAAQAADEVWAAR
jgi:hypothetical protein